jgi:hypothetical protein
MTSPTDTPAIPRWRCSTIALRSMRFRARCRTGHGVIVAERSPSRPTRAVRHVRAASLLVRRLLASRGRSLHGRAEDLGRGHRFCPRSVLRSRVGSNSGSLDVTHDCVVHRVTMGQRPHVPSDPDGLEARARHAPRDERACPPRGERARVAVQDEQRRGDRPVPGDRGAVGGKRRRRAGDRGGRGPKRCLPSLTQSVPGTLAAPVVDEEAQPRLGTTAGICLPPAT